MSATTSLPRRPLGRTGLEVTPLCLGGGTLRTGQGVATVRRFLQGPLNLIDSSANYGEGESERCIGAALAEAGGVPDGVVVATKVDRHGETGDFSGEQVRRSAEGSLRRLGLDRLQLLYLHDPEFISFEEGMAAGGPVEEVLRRVRAMEAACERHGVPLAAAALQFSLRSERIASTIVGVSHPEQVDQMLRLASWEVPASLWRRLEPLAAPPELWQW